MEGMTKKESMIQRTEERANKLRSGESIVEKPKSVHEKLNERAKEQAKKNSPENEGPDFWSRVKKQMGNTTENIEKPKSVHEKLNERAKEQAKKNKETEPNMANTAGSPASLNTIENSVEAQANAKPGDVINGHVLTQGDIDWAKEQVGTTEDMSVNEAEGIEGSNIASPEVTEAKPSLESPEVQKAIGAGGAEIEAAQGDDAAQEDFKQKYCNAIWDNYDLGMSKQPKFKPGWQLPATILSIGLSVFSGGLIPPVNFMKLTGKEDEYNAAMDMWKETMGKSRDLAQEKERASTMPTAKAEGMDAASGIASQDAIDQAAEVNAAERGAQADARLGTEGEIEAMEKQAEIDYKKMDIDRAAEVALKKLEMGHEKEMAKLNTSLQKDIAYDTAALQIEIADAAANNDMEKIRELYRQAVKKDADTLKALGYDTTPDGFLKYIRNSGGTSNAQARIRQALDIVDTGVNAIGTVGGVISDMQGNAINAASSILPML